MLDLSTIAPYAVAVIAGAAGALGSAKIIIGLIRQQKRDEWKEACEAKDQIIKTLDMKLGLAKSHDPEIRELIKENYRLKAMYDSTPRDIGD